METRPGRHLGDFELIRELGSGGMGTVWEAEQTSLGRRVALKILAPHISMSPTSLQRFQREAEAGARLTHPNIVAVHSVGEADGTHYIAQELVEGGGTIADQIKSNRDLSELPEDYYKRIAELFVKIADALQHAHDGGIIHRDIKPANILLAKDGEPKVADFGLAQVEDALELSRTGEFAGTPFYMSPEQAMSKRIGIDHRTDIFSLGVTLWEVLALQRPFEGDTSQQVLQKIVTEDPEDPRKLRSRCPRDLAVICQKALEKSVSQRFHSMADLAADLRRFLSNEPIHAKPPTQMQRAAKWTKRNPVKSASSMVFLIGVAVAVPLWLDAREKEYISLLVAEFLPSSADVSNLSQGLSPDAFGTGTRSKGNSRILGTEGYYPVPGHSSKDIVAHPSRSISITCNLFIADLWEKGRWGRKHAVGIRHPEFLLFANEYVLWMMARDGHSYALELAEEALSGWKAIDNKEEEIEAESAGFWKSVYAMKRNNETGRAIESLAKIYWEIGQLEKSKALFLELLHRNQELWPEGTDGHRTTRKLPEGGTSTTIHHSDQRSVSVTQTNLNRLREEIRSQ